MRLTKHYTVLSENPTKGDWHPGEGDVGDVLLGGRRPVLGARHVPHLGGRGWGPAAPQSAIIKGEGQVFVDVNVDDFMVVQRLHLQPGPRLLVDDFDISVVYEEDHLGSLEAGPRTLP